MLKKFCSYESLWVIKIRDINYFFVIFLVKAEIELCAYGLIPGRNH